MSLHRLTIVVESEASSEADFLKLAAQEVKAHVDRLGEDRVFRSLAHVPSPAEFVGSTRLSYTEDAVALDARRA